MAAALKMSDVPSQLLLWLDGVGAYLVCLNPRLTLGQAGPESAPDLAVLADVSRHHATLYRGAEGYLLEAVRKVALNGQPVEQAFLRSGDRLTMGSTCQLLFTQAVPVSGSARLDLVSGQRWLRPVHAVLLMAETLVIGPGPQAHVIAEEMTQSLVLFRSQAGLALRYGGKLVVAGQPHQNQGPVRPGAHVAADTLSFVLEGV